MLEIVDVMICFDDHVHVQQLKMDTGRLLETPHLFPPSFALPLSHPGYSLSRRCLLHPRHSLLLLLLQSFTMFQQSKTARRMIWMQEG